MAYKNPISIEPQLDIIPGEYIGYQFGYTLKLQLKRGNESPSFKLDRGIRGASKVKCIVNNSGYVEVTEYVSSDRY